MQVDSKTYEALRRLGKSPDGTALRNLLDAALESTKTQLVGAPSEQVPRLQGRAQMLDEITKLLG